VAEVVSGVKSKKFSFRISPEEYRVLREAADAHGIWSLSEFARHAMGLLVNDKSKSPLETEVRELRTKVDMLSAEIERLTRVAPTPAFKGYSKTLPENAK